jgi:hypothetical protein
MKSRMLIGVLVALAVAVAACGGDSDGGERAKAGAQPPVPLRQPPEPPSVVWPAPDRYEPEAVDGYPNGKRLAARVAATALTYPRGASARDVARRLGSSRASRRELAAAIAPAVDPAMASSAKVVYPQLAGVTPTSLGAMVVVRQRLRSADGRSRAVTRVVDVRLRREGGPWQLDRIGSVGGRTVRRPADLSRAARRVVDNPRITLTDSARWDVYRGDIDEGLLEALAAIAEQQRVSVSVLRSGHPRDVWETSRPSAHSRGYAADIYAVGGQLVIRQQDPGSPAYELASSLVADGAGQVGSPWVIPPGGARSFSDEVHRDHLHVQWSTLP